MLVKSTNAYLNSQKKRRYKVSESVLKAMLALFLLCHSYQLHGVTLIKMSYLDDNLILTTNIKQRNLNTLLIEEIHFFWLNTASNTAALSPPNYGCTFSGVFFFSWWFSRTMPAAYYQKKKNVFFLNAIPQYKKAFLQKYNLKRAVYVINGTPSFFVSLKEVIC